MWLRRAIIEGSGGRRRGARPTLRLPSVHTVANVFPFWATACSHPFSAWKLLQCQGRHSTRDDDHRGPHEGGWVRLPSARQVGVSEQRPPLLLSLLLLLFSPHLQKFLDRHPRSAGMAAPVQTPHGRGFNSSLGYFDHGKIAHISPAA